MERSSSSSEVNGGSSFPSSSVSSSTCVPNTASEHGVVTSRTRTAIPAIALTPTPSELSLASSNCPNCKLLNRYLRVSREWNNFFRLKLDQRDTLLHIAADYKRQKQRSLQLQMSLDQQTRECSEMREQLTNLLLEIQPLRERLQLAEQRVEEELKRREKAESEECNLRFLLEQQNHRLEDLGNRVLPSVSEKKLNVLQTKVKKMKMEEIRMLRTEWELRDATSLAREREVLALKKAYWGLSLALKYGRCLKQVWVPPKEEWSKLQRIMKQILENLDRQYSSYCSKVPFHHPMEDWINDFPDQDREESDACGIESGAKQLEKLIQDDNEEKISEGEMEEDEKMKRKQVKKIKTKLEERENQEDYMGQHSVSRFKKDSSLVDKHEPENSFSSSRGEEEVTSVSIFDSSIENIDCNTLSSLNNNVEEPAPHMLNTEIRKETQQPILSTSIKKIQQPIRSSATKKTQDLMILSPIKTPIESTAIKKTQESVKSLSLLDTSLEDSDSDVLSLTQNSTKNTGTQKKVQEPMKSPIRNAQESVKSASLLDTSLEDSDSDVLSRPRDSAEGTASLTRIRKKMQEQLKSSFIRKTQQLTKITSILDTSMEDSDSDLPSFQNSAEVAAPCKENTQIQKKIEHTVKSPKRKTQEPVISASLMDTSMDSDSDLLPSLKNGVKETISHTVGAGIKKKAQDLKKSLSILDTNSEDSDEEPSLRPQTSTSGHSVDVDLKGTEELPSLTTTMNTNMEKAHNDSHAARSEETSLVTSYHLDEELRSILEKMRPHEKLEDMDISLSEGTSPLPETDLPVPDMKQDFLGSLSDSEEEEKDGEKEMLEQNGDNRDNAGLCIVPRILTTQISEEFTVAESHKGNSLLEDLDISTDTIDQEREDEKEERYSQTQVLLPHFQSSQSFSFDMEECNPLPAPPALASVSGEISKEQYTHCQSQFPQSVDEDGNSMCSHQGGVPKQNKVLLKEMRHLFGAVDDTTIISGRETKNSDHQSVGMAGENNVLSMCERAIHTELCQEGQASPNIKITENKLIEAAVNDARIIAAQKVNNNGKEQRFTEIEEENNGATLESSSTEGIEKITIRSDEDETTIVKEKTEDIGRILTEREEQTTKTSETRGKEVMGGFTETAEENIEEEEDRTTVKKERTTPSEQERTIGKETSISEDEKETNIFVNDMRNTKVEKPQEERIRGDTGNDTEIKNKRTLETKQERTTRAEDERNYKNGKNRATEEEEEKIKEAERERTIETVEQICTGVAEKSSLAVELEKVAEASDETKESDTEGTIGFEDVITTEIKEIGTTVSDEEQTTGEEEKKTPKSKRRNPPHRPRRSLRILDKLEKENSQEEEEEEEQREKEKGNTDEEMERGPWTRRLRRQKGNDRCLDGDVQKENEQKSRQYNQRQQKSKTEESHLVGGKRSRGKVEEMLETKHSRGRILDDKQKRQKEKERESDQEQETNIEDQGKKRKQKEGRINQEMEEKRRKQEKKTNQEKDEKEEIEQEGEEKKLMPERKRRKPEIEKRNEEEEYQEEQGVENKEEKLKEKNGEQRGKIIKPEKEGIGRKKKKEQEKRVQEEDETLRKEEEERKIKEEKERKVKEEEERKMKEEEERKRKEEERKIKEEEERRMKEEEERKRKEEERKIKEERERKGREEEERKMKEEERKRKEEERKAKEEEEMKMKEEEERKRKEEKRKIKEEERKIIEEERKIKEERERKMKEEKERKMKEEERNMKEEERKIEEERERKMKEEEEKKIKEEEERKRKEEERKVKEEEERKMKEEEERKRKEEERKIKEEKERKVKEEEERKMKEEEERKRKEEERKKKEEEERKMIEKEEKKMKEEEERKRKEEERKVKEEEEREMKEEEERKRKEEERKIKEERERKIEEEEERKIKEEEERKMKEEERKIKEEERKVKEERERKMKEEEERKMKEKKERRMREIEKRMVKGKGERKIMNLEEMNRKSQKDKGKMYEQKREGQEQNKSCNNTEEKQCESKSEEGKRKNRETEIKQQEKQKRVSGVSLSDIKNSTSERESDIGASHSKNQEKIVFSWGPKRRQWRKYIKFHRMSRLTKVVPDPLGSLHHSVFAIECRVNQGSAQEQTNRSTTNGWLVRDPPRETSQVQNNGARDSITEEVSTRTRKTLPREQNIKEKIRRQLWDEQTCRGRKTVARRNKRISKIRDGSSSSSSRNRDKSSSRNSSRNRDKSSSKNRDNSSSRNSSRNRDKSSSRNRDKSSRRSRDKSSSNSSRSRSRSNIRNRDKRYGSSSSRTSIRNRHRIYESSSSSSSRSRSRSNIRNRDKRYGSSSSRTSIRNRHRRYESSSSRSRSRSSIRSRDRSYGSSCIDSRSCSRNRSRSSSRIRDRSNSSSSSRNRKRNNNSSNKNRDSSSSSKNKDRSKTSDNSSSRSSIRNKSRSNSRNSNRSRDRSSSISSSSSNCARETVCTFPREVKSGDRAPQQTCGSTKSAKTGNLSTLAKSRISKADLFGTDSDSSGSSEEKRKEQVKKSRKGKEDKQQQQPPMSLCNKGKNFRSASLIVRKAGGKWKSVKQPQFRRFRRLSSSYSSLPACLEEKLTNRRRDHSSDPETDLTTSDSSVTHRRVSSKCQRMVIGSEDEDSQDDRIPGVHLRRQRKTRMDGQISDSNNDNHNSPAKQKRTSHLTPNPHNACRVTQNKKQIPVDEELPEPHSKSTPSISSLTLKGKASKTLIAQQRKYTPAAKEREHQGISSDCRKLSSFSSKQQQKIKPSILKIHQTSASIPEVSTSLQSTRKREKSLDCIKQDQSRNSIKSEEDPMREKSMITSSLSKESKHTILLENPSHPFRKWKRNSLSWDPSSRQQKYHKLSDSCDMSDNLDETDRVDDNKDGLVLSQINSDTSMQSHDGDALMMSGDESETQVMSESHDPDIYNGLILSRSDSDSEDGMVIEENTSNSIGSSKDSVPQFSESIPETQVAATNRSQEGQVMRSSHLGPVALIDQPKFRKKPAPSPMPTTMRTSIPAGPEYIEKLFSSLNQKVERSSAGLTQNNHSTYPHGTNTSEAAGTASLNQPVRGIDYQGQFPVFLPNIYGTLQSAPAIEKPKPMSGTNPSHCTPHHSREAPHSALPSSSHAFSSTEQIQPNSTSNKSHPVGYKHTTDGTSQVAPLQPLPSHSQNLQCSDASPVLKCNLQQMPWLPEIRLEEVTSGQQQKTLAIEELEEALEEILATRLGSKWWVAGLQQLCASINTKILPYFLRLVLKCIMCADPRDPHTKPKSLPPKLYQLFQVVFVIEQRLTPHYPRSLHNALLRAIQAIVSKPDFKITPQTLASLTTWYIASTSIDGQAKKGQKWRRARTFLMDLLFHHPNTVHLALLTGATASRGVFCKNIKNRVTSGLELVIVWLAHYGAWVGEPGVRSDLTKWLEQHCNMKKPPRNPAPLIKNLVTLLDPVKKRDLRWGAATSLVVLARWHSRAWARKHLLPPLLTAAGEISMAVSHQEKSCDADSKLIEDFSIKISHLFSNLSQALPRGPQEKDNDDVVEKLKDAVTLIFCSSHHTNDLQT